MTQTPLKVWILKSTVLVLIANPCQLYLKVSAVELKPILFKYHQVRIPPLHHFVNMQTNLGHCITEHMDFKKIIDRTVLEVNLKLLWSCGEETGDGELFNANLRYSAYRSLHVW